MIDTAYDELRRLAGDVSRETYEDLRFFEREFRRWSAKINLAAPSTLPDLWQRHVLDSAQLLPIGGPASIWLDLGSGGGFPGAILAILLKTRPGASITLVESNRKKAAFLSSTLGTLKAPAKVLPIRIEEASKTGLVPHVITARALAPLVSLLGLSEPWLSKGARALFHKGRDYRSEVANCADVWQFDLVMNKSAIDDGSVILDISNLKASRRT